MSDYKTKLKELERYITHLNKYVDIVEDLNKFYKTEYVLARSDYVRILTKHIKIHD